MGVDIYQHPSETNPKCVFVCNTTDRAFGPVMHGSYARVDAFHHFLKEDPRTISENLLESRYYEFQRLLYLHQVLTGVDMGFEEHELTPEAEDVKRYASLMEDERFKHIVRYAGSIITMEAFYNYIHRGE